MSAPSVYVTPVQVIQRFLAGDAIANSPSAVRHRLDNLLTPGIGSNGRITKCAAHVETNNFYCNIKFIYNIHPDSAASAGMNIIKI